MLPLIVFLPFIGALLVPLAATRAGLRPALAASLTAGLALILLIVQMPAVYSGQVLIDSHGCEVVDPVWALLDHHLA